MLTRSKAKLDEYKSARKNHRFATRSNVGLTSNDVYDGGTLVVGSAGKSTITRNESVGNICDDERWCSSIRHL